MGVLFGTDGIRAVANDGIDSRLALRVGQAAAQVLSGKKDRRPLFFIGKDTRVSSDMLECALSAGLCSMGAEVVSLGVLPTPAIAYLTTRHKADAGIVISASHNPFEHNGIKIFGQEGFKLSDDLEDEIESLVLSECRPEQKRGAEIGRVRDGSGLISQYADYVSSTAPLPPSGLRVLIDCANGAASSTARGIFSKFDIQADYIFDKPNGVNINVCCGSTSTVELSRRVLDGAYDMGIAFDGDADRVAVIDEKGAEVNGDRLLAVCALALKREGRLKGDAVVSTVMSNAGLRRFLLEKGINIHYSDVGDKNVLELMRAEGLIIGAEPSGHMIFLDLMTSGDGQLAAVQFLSEVSERGLPVSELTAEIPMFPQVLINIASSKDRETRLALLEHETLKTALAGYQADFGEFDRILIRPSGTEAKIRVFVECEEEQRARETAEALAALIKELQINGKI